MEPSQDCRGMSHQLRLCGLQKLDHRIRCVGGGIVMVEQNSLQPRPWPPFSEILKNLWQTNCCVPISSNCLLFLQRNGSHMATLEKKVATIFLPTLRGRFTLVGRSSSGKIHTAD